jgi:transposase
VLEFFKGLSSCLVGLEVCGTAHHWAREIAALGHTVRLMPPATSNPMSSGKTDAADAEAICEAVTRPTMRFVAIKTVDQQAALMLHKTRDLLVRQRTINGLRGHLAEFGVIAAKGPVGVKAAIEALHESQEHLPEVARLALHGIVDQLRQLGTAIERPEARIVAWHSAALLIFSARITHTSSVRVTEVRRTFGKGRVSELCVMPAKWYVSGHVPTLPAARVTKNAPDPSKLPVRAGAIFRPKRQRDNSSSRSPDKIHQCLEIYQPR